LLRHADNALDVALFLDKHLVEHLREDDPTQRLHAGNFGDCMLAIEGVSHFLCVAWNAYYEKQVTLLELELQAEIDKYVTAAYLFARQRGERFTPTLHRWLFAAPRYDARLAPHELTRYREASHYAGKYCRYLERHYISAKATTRMVPELRRLYRLSRSEKIRRINTTANA
jgi:hypothetical protein